MTNSIEAVRGLVEAWFQAECRAQATPKTDHGSKKIIPPRSSAWNDYQFRVAFEKTDLSQVLKDLERYKAALELIADPNTKVTEVCEKFEKPVTSALDIWWSRHIAECALSGTKLPNQVTQGAQP